MKLVRFPWHRSPSLPLLACLVLLLLEKSQNIPAGAHARLLEDALVGGLSRTEGSSYYHKAFPVVQPDTAHTHLSIAREGLDAIARIRNAIAVVAVIGPYRSGKSFLLNQLLALSCNEGFGVGHMRDTKTKGVWVWGEPLEIEVDGERTSVLFLDTEGFESIGKSTVYDDRIFALAAIVSSVLIYNLPETVKEADIAKLSFAVELAEEFYGRVKGRDSHFEPARLLWLIQRDFLEGKTVQQMVEEALQPVPNDENDKDVAQVNRIRQSLALMASNDTAYGLRQPHLLRTKLCDMADSELDAGYVQQRDQLRRVVAGLVAPKLWGGRRLNGREFASLLEQTLEALNRGKIPSAGSVVDSFNQGVRERCMDMYRSRMALLPLPVSEEQLLEAHGAAAEGARAMFEKERFGRRAADEALRPLQDELVRAEEKLRETNLHLSAQRCEGLYASCEDQLEYLENMRLPSMAKFDAGLLRCNHSAEATCLGPSKAHYVERLKKMWTRERSRFSKEYNRRLFNWIIIFSLVMVAVGRFVIKWTFLELAAWGVFVFLETYTRIFWSMEGLYHNSAWRIFVSVWEAVVFNPVIDLDRWAIPLAWSIMIFLLVCRCYRFRKRTLFSVAGRRRTSPE